MLFAPQNPPVNLVQFPEGTLGWIFATSRTDVLPYCATIPDPAAGPVSICPGNGAPAIDAITSTWEALVALSCAAMAHRFTILVNVCDLQDCTDHPACPIDGMWLRNTEVALGPDGTLLTRYYKSHLFGEANIFNPVPAAERVLSSAVLPIPHTTVTAGILTCFDMEFAYPWRNLSSVYHVRHALVSSWYASAHFTFSETVKLTSKS